MAYTKNKITAKQQKIHKQPDTSTYKPETLPIDTTYPAVKTKQDNLNDSINRNLQRLQNVAANPEEIQKNLDGGEPQQNFFFEALRWLGAPMDWATSLLSSAFASDEEKLELGISGEKSGLDVANEVFMTGSPKAMGDEPWMTANLFQTMFGKGVSTDEWDPVMRILLSMGTDTFADPMNILLNPVFGGIAKGIGKGVKYGGKGVKKALGKVPTKTAVAGSKAVQESAQLLSSGFRQSVESIPEYAKELKTFKRAEALVSKYDAKNLGIKTADDVKVPEPKNVKEARQYMEDIAEKNKLSESELASIDLSTPAAKRMKEALEKEGIKPTNDNIRLRLREANRNKLTPRDIVNYGEDAFGIKTRKNRLAEIAKEQSIAMNKEHEFFYKQKKQANRLFKEHGKPFKEMIRGESTEGSEAILNELKRQGLVSQALDMSDLKGNRALVSDMFKSYKSSIMVNELETNARGYLQMSLPDLMDKALLPNNLDSMPAELLKKVQKSLAMPSDKKFLVDDVVNVQLTAPQLDKLVSTFMKLGIIPDAESLSDYIRYQNVGTEADTLYQIFTTDKLLKNWNKVKRSVNEEAVNTPGILKFLKERNNSQEANIRQVKRFFNKFGDPNKLTEVRATENWLKSWTSGETGISLNKWNKLKPIIEQYNPKIAIEINNIIKLSLIKYKKLSRRNILKPTKDLKKLNELLAKNPKIKGLFEQWEPIVEKALKSDTGNRIIRKGQNLGVKADDTLENLFRKSDKALDDSISSIQKGVQKELNQLVDIGKKYSKTESPFIKKQIADWKTNILDKRVGLMKDLGAGEQNITDFLYHLDFRGNALTDSVGSPLAKNYLSKVSRSDNEIRSIKTKEFKDPNIKTQKDKWTAGERAVSDSKFLGRTSEINKAIRFREANNLIRRGLVDPSQSAAKQMSDALKMSSKWDLFIPDAMVSANKSISAVMKTWGELGVIRKAFENKFIVAYKDIPTKDFARNRYMLLDESSLGNVLARGDMDYARKLASGESLNRKEMNEILQNILGAENVQVNAKGELAEPFYIDRRVNQLLLNSAPSEEEAKLFLKVFDKTLGGWKKIVLASVGYLWRLFGGDIMHGMISGVPMGHMVTGWAKGVEKLVKFSNAEKVKDKFILKMINSSDESVQKILEANDPLLMAEYVRKNIDPKYSALLDEKKSYLDQGILSGGQFTQDRDLGGILNPKDGEIMFDKLMNYNIKQIKNPQSINALKSVMKGTGNAFSGIARTGQHSAEASRLAAYWYFNGNISKLKPLKGKLGVGKAPLDDMGNKLPMTKNYQAAGYDSVMEATDFALYGNRRLAGFEQKYLTRMMPFYSFFRFSLEQNLKSAMKGNIKPYYNIQKYMKNIKEGQRIDNDDLSDYAIQNNYLPIRLDDEKISLINYGYTPSTLLNLVGNSNNNIISELTGQMNPLFKAILETATGTNAYTGIEYDNAMESIAANLIPKWNTVKKVIRQADKDEKYASRDKDWFFDALPSLFTQIYTEDVELNRLYETDQGLQGMINDIIKKDGFVPTYKSLMERYNSYIIKQKKYY